MSITITPAANERMRHFLAGTPSAAGVRFGVKRTGCSGFADVVDLAEPVGDGDRLVEEDGLPLIVDAQSTAMHDGTCLNSLRAGLNDTFVIQNPHTPLKPALVARTT